MEIGFRFFFSFSLSFICVFVCVFLRFLFSCFLWFFVFSLFTDFLFLSHFLVFFGIVFSSLFRFFLRFFDFSLVLHFLCDFFFFRFFIFLSVSFGFVFLGFRFFFAFFFYFKTNRLHIREEDKDSTGDLEDWHMISLTGTSSGQQALCKPECSCSVARATASDANIRITLIKAMETRRPLLGLQDLHGWPRTARICRPMRG